MKDFDVIVVGGGAAGLLAAGSAAQAGAKVALFEKMNQTGRKIGISGKGRCNITNAAELPDFINHFGKNGKFLRQCFSHFFRDELLTLIETMGVDISLERGGRYFPKSGKALDVVKALNAWNTGFGVTQIRSQSVSKILVNESGAYGVVSGAKQYTARAIIIATGGKSYPKTGSSGEGYTYLKDLGHTIVPVRQALVPLNCAMAELGSLDGLTLKNIEAQLMVDGKKASATFGEASFTEFGMTGPIILSLSGLATEALAETKDVVLSLDFKPALSHQKLDARIIRDLTEKYKENIEKVLQGLMPRQLIPLCLSHCQIAPQTSAGTFPAVFRKKIVNWLKSFPVKVKGSRSFDEAIVCAGGVKLKEVNPTTMESRKVDSLFIAGEILDIHADTGGYNLQAAFSTGWLAGKKAADKVLAEKNG